VLDAVEVDDSMVESEREEKGQEGKEPWESPTASGL
jgi:hypothetical protein